MTQWLTVRDIASMFRVHPKTVWVWVRQGVLPKPTYLRPKVPRWKMAEIDGLMRG